MNREKVPLEGCAKFDANDCLEQCVLSHDKSVVVKYCTQFFDSKPPLHLPDLFGLGEHFHNWQLCHLHAE